MILLLKPLIGLTICLSDKIFIYHLLFLILIIKDEYCLILFLENMKSILVTQASGLIGYSILRSLKESKYNYHLYGSTIYDNSIALAFCDKFLKCPLTTDKNYINWLLKIIEEYAIDLIIPAATVDVTCWNTHRAILEESNVKMVLNSHELITLCDDKWEFYKVLEKINCHHAIPTTLESDFDNLVKKLGLPFLLKPRQSEASRGIIKVTNEEIFNSNKNRIGTELMVQQIVGNNDEEYTAIAFCDGKGEYYNIIIFKRKLAMQGYTNEAEVCFNKNIEEAVLNICKIFKPIGPTNFQFRIQENRIVLLEINARFSSSTSIASAFGFNIPIMAAEFYLDDIIPKKPEIKKGRAIRYIEDHIFYT